MLRWISSPGVYKLPSGSIRRQLFLDVFGERYVHIPTRLLLLYRRWSEELQSVVVWARVFAVLRAS